MIKKAKASVIDFEPRSSFTRNASFQANKKSDERKRPFTAKSIARDKSIVDNLTKPTASSRMK